MSGPRRYRHEQVGITDKETKNMKHAKSRYLEIFILI